MTDKDKPTADKPVTKEPKQVEPTSGGAAPASSDVAAAGSDKYGRQLYNVTCASCGKPAQVPFKPSQDRPVYCRDCFMQMRRDRGMRRGSPREDSR